MTDKAIPVRVAVRIRPLVQKEKDEGSQHFVNKVLNNPQVTIKGSNEAFTYDYVFGPDESQSQVYESAVAKTVGKIFKGYNVTILAYGQTGSGKTFSMGTADTSSMSNSVISQNSGIIQRAVRDLFLKINEDSSLTFEISVSFLELYMEKVYDLLSKTKNEEVDIREDPKNGIKIHGLTEISVLTWEQTLKCLENGSQNRRTGATAMNHQSSRSHAVFTLTINQINKETKSMLKSSKFHLVDLAGSERASKTHAVGERFAEGVNINKGLLALGNVISALCESNPRHIPYRDSKLTRLLQDSLGGNSHTLMIACVSPADSNYEETLSTLRYADRARKIKNKPIVNEDPTVAEVLALRAQVQQLLNMNGNASFAEVEQLRQQLKYAEEEKTKLTHALQLALQENTNMCERALLADAANQQMKQRLEELQVQTEQTLEAINCTVNETSDSNTTKTIEQVLSIKSKIEEIKEVQRKGEIEQVTHDMQCNEADKENMGEKENSDTELESSSPKRLSKLGADMALRQAALSNNLKELNTQLAMKVHMVNKMTQDQQGPYSVVKAHYDATVSDLENQISALQQEKEELANLLTQASSNINACKISEQRRKRLQELEPQISELKKKIQEQANIIKLKQRTEEQLKKFNSDIQFMRAQKVKLVRQMREENEKFRTWRQQKEREVARLKDQDRKRQGQLQKMEVLHAKQQNVLRRKMEDAMAVSKRLKEALSLHSSKPSNKSSSTSSAPEIDTRIKNWLLSELDLLTKTKEADLTLESLIESRRTLASRHAKLESKLANGDNDPAFVQSLQSEIAIVAADMDLRTEQIVELKQKIASADLDNKAKTRFDYLQTMVEAKIALKFLLDESVNARGETFRCCSEVQDLRSELEDLQRQHEEALHEFSNCQDKKMHTKQKHQAEIGKLCRDYEEKMLTLMRQLPPVGLKESAEHKLSEQDLMERLRIQQEELERCCSLQEKLNLALNEIDQLKLQRPPSAEMKAPLVLPKLKKSKTVYKTPVNLSPQSDEDDDQYDSDDDPEWRNTPIAKRIKKLKEEDEPPKMMDIEGKKGAGKRLSRSHCACRTGGCRSCVCSKDNRSCTKECGCFATGVCKNAATDHVLQQEDLNRIQEQGDQSRMLNETFDLGRKRSQPSSKENSQTGEELENELSDTQPLKKSRLGKLSKKGGYFVSND